MRLRLLVSTYEILIQKKPTSSTFTLQSFLETSLQLIKTRSMTSNEKYSFDYVYTYKYLYIPKYRRRLVEEFPLNPSLVQFHC